MGYRKISPLESAKSLKTPWTQLKLGWVENYDLKVAVYHGEYNRHVHERHDEFIYVLSGTIHIEFDSDDVTLGPGEGIVIGNGTAHKSSCGGRAEVLLFEKDTIMDDYVKLEDK